jgi:DNA-binding MarR family transcriptional regulator
MSGHNKAYRTTVVDERFERLRALKIGVPMWKVLLALAYDGPQSMYTIFKKHGSKYPVIHTATMKLEKVRWIRTVKKKRSEKNVMTKIYGLTPEGLLWILSKAPKTVASHDIKTLLASSGEEKTKKHFFEFSKLANLNKQMDVRLHLLREFSSSPFGIHRIAKSNADLFPLVFCKWESYKNTGVADWLSFNFVGVADSTLAEYYYGQGAKGGARELQRIFTYKAYGALLEWTGRAYARAEPEFKEELLKGISSMWTENPELVPLLDQIMSELEPELEENLAFLNRIKRAHRSRARNHKHASLMH